MRKDITIVTAGREDVLKAWIAAFRRSPNFGKFTVRVGDYDFSDQFRKFVSDIGFELFSMKSACDLSRRIFCRNTTHHAMWHSKVSAMKLGSKTRWCFWLDHDCEVRGDLEPIIDYGLGLGKWMCAPKYASMPPKRYPNQRVTQNGMVLVDVADERLSKWKNTMESRRDPNDETALPFALKCFAYADDVIGDLYRPEWYASVDCYDVVWRSISGATELLKDSQATVRHWCAGVGKREFMKLYQGEKA